MIDSEAVVVTRDQLEGSSQVQMPALAAAAEAGSCRAQAITQQQQRSGKHLLNLLLQLEVQGSPLGPWPGPQARRRSPGWPGRLSRRAYHDLDDLQARLSSLPQSSELLPAPS